MSRRPETLEMLEIPLIGLPTSSHESIQLSLSWRAKSSIMAHDSPTSYHEAYHQPIALESNLSGIQVKDIVKEVEDYLKTYSSTAIDIWWVENVFEHVNANNNGTNNVINNVVGEEDLLQLLDSRGGSHVTNVPQLDVEDFTSWKDREMCNDLILSHEEPSETRDTKTAALRLKFNAFKALEGEKLKETYTRLKILLNELENKYVKIPQAKVNATFGNSLPKKWKSSSTSKALISTTCTQDSDSNVEEDTKSNRRVGASRKPLDKSNEALFACGKLGHFQKDFPTNKTSSPSYPLSNKSFNKPKFHTNLSSSHQHNQNADNGQKDYRVKYKALTAELALLTKKIDVVSKSKSEKGLVAESFGWDEESLSSEDEGVTRVKTFMAIAENEPVVGNTDARSGQWVETIMKKVQILLSLNDGDERKQVLDYTNPILGHIVRIEGGRGKRKESVSSKEGLFTKGENSHSDTTPEVTSDNESGCDNQDPLASLLKLSGLSPLVYQMMSYHLMVTEKESSVNIIKKKAQTKTPSVLDFSLERKAGSSTKQLCLTLMKEVK
ncbi:hypothetical protein Tco_0566163 [Tanacetum coccineum]